MTGRNDEVRGRGIPATNALPPPPHHHHPHAPSTCSAAARSDTYHSVELPRCTVYPHMHPAQPTAQCSVPAYVHEALEKSKSIRRYAPISPFPFPTSMFDEDGVVRKQTGARNPRVCMACIPCTEYAICAMRLIIQGQLLYHVVCVCPQDPVLLIYSPWLWGCGFYSVGPSLSSAICPV